MSTLNYTLLDAQKVQPVVSALRQLLADVQVYYTNLRDFHWNVQGTNFYNLHVEFERLYDGIAERLLQLGETPEHRYSEYLKVSQVKEAEVTHCGHSALTQVLETEKQLIAQERVVLAAAQEAGDEATCAMVSDWLREQEKLIWMLVATLKQECSK